MDLALLLIRAVVGGLIMAHGLGKLNGFLGAGFGFSGTAGYLDGFGLRPGRFWAAVVVITETIAGLLFASGLVTPLAGAAIAGTMLVAARTDHGGKGPWIFNAGWEHVLTNATIAIALVGTGPGRYSLDRALGIEAAGAGYLLGALLLAVAAAGATLALRRPASALEHVTADA